MPSRTETRPLWPRYGAALAAIAAATLGAGWLALRLPGPLPGLLFAVLVLLALALAAFAVFAGRTAVDGEPDRASRETEERLARFAAIVESSNDAILGQNVDGVITSWNAAAERMYGYTAEEVVGKPIHLMVPPDRLGELKVIYSAVLAGQRVEHVETERLRRDGERLQVSLTISPIHDREGRIVGFSKIARDISERKRAEEELTATARELQDAFEEIQVAEEELRSQNEDLLAVQSALQQANDAKDRFLAALSHELRTPLTPVLAFVSDLERDTGLPAAAHAKLVVIRRNVELEARLIDDLLDLTRITHGKLEIKPEATDLNAVLEHALHVCCEEEEIAKRIRVVRDFAAGDCRVWGDAPRLTQVFWNLFNNAVKFMPKGGELRVRTAVEGAAEGGRRMRIEIADTGIGIDPEALPRIFDGFEQGARKITRQFGGLGLGLAISKAIVDLHGGRITAASDGLGKGTRFTVELPLAPGPSTAERAAAAGQEGRAAEERSLHLLLVEDHADTAAAFAELLRASGYEVTVAGSVEQGLQAAGEERFDLVISDLGLPDGHGNDLMRELARRHGLSGIALSGYGMEEDVRQSREAGFARHLTKPINFQALKEAIRDVTGEERRG